MSDSKPHSVFSDPETQALHERNLEWLRLMKEDPGWALSRLHRLSELEEQLEAVRYWLQRDPHDPWETDISDYSDEWVAGFLAGQENAQDVIEGAIEDGSNPASRPEA